MERHRFGRYTHSVYTRGSGPPVIVMHELPGITQGAVTFAERVVERGFMAVLPSLVGSPRRHAGGAIPMLRIAQICISGEFRKLAIGATSPVVDWLRTLARRLSGDEHAPVGAVGLCLTGGFALAMAVDPWIEASVVAEPALPAPLARSGNVTWASTPSTCRRSASGRTCRSSGPDSRTTRSPPARGSTGWRRSWGPGSSAARSNRAPAVLTGSRRRPTPCSRTTCGSCHEMTPDVSRWRR